MAYTNSSLVDYIKISPNKTSPRNHVIDCITIHCVVGQCSVESLGNVFASASRQASSNYGVGYDGRIGMYVEEKDRSWCSDSRENDNRAITIEVASDTTHPYAVNDKALSALIDLVADICKRNDIKKLVWSTNKSDRVNHKNGCNMTVHRDYANKSCPGQYLYDKHGYIAEQVNKKLGVTATSNLEFKEGDIVNFAGGIHYGSTNATSGSAAPASKAKVTAVYEGGKHPYHIRAVNEKGAFINGVYGWVDASTISEIKAQSIAPVTSNKIDTVKEVQNWANANYKSGLVVDGIYGANTKIALVKILQTELNQTYNAKLIVDGIWGNLTRAACPTLVMGAKNDVVKVLQALLVCNGYSRAYVDGDYGSGTFDSVKLYQGKTGLVVDGMAGKNTFAKLCR